MIRLPVPELPFEQHTLGNGLRVVLHEDRRLPLVAINLWYHVGSKNESPGRTGFAHLFEHMLFQGSGHVGTNDHFRLIQQVGGVANGSTWYDRTNYYETLPAHALDLGLWLESDRMGFLLDALTPEKLETQRSVVMNERRQRVDNQPYGHALERLHELLYPSGHPYSWPVIGYLEDIAAATLDEVAAFFRDYYAPANAVLTLAGDFVPATALERVAHWFADLPRREPPPPPRLTTAEPGELRLEVQPDRVELPRLYLGFRVPAYGSPEWYAGALLAETLAGGKASEWYQDLVYRRQIAQDVGVYFYPTELEATVLVVATCKPGVAAGELERALLAHLGRARDGGPDEADVDRARARFLTATFEDLETLDRKADTLGQFATYFGDPGGLRREIESYLALGTAELRRFAERFLDPARRAQVTVVPAAKP
jgi:predicted Zn-dependent peptidase